MAYYNGGYMHIYLSTLTEVDYETSLNSIENNYNLNPESSWQDRARVKNLRKLEKIGRAHV